MNDKFSNKPKSRKEAIEQEEVFYYNGKLCKNNHDDLKHIERGCKECTREYQRKYRKNLSKDKKLEIYKKNRDRYERNKEKYDIKKKEWYYNNLEYNREYFRNYYHTKRKTKPFSNLNNAIKCAIRRCINGGKQHKHWEEFVDFTLEELINHLEKQFTPEMNWDNYGDYWHVDHIKPISLCTNFDEIWELENLQPLTKFDNLSKGNKYIGHPSNPIPIDKEYNDNPTTSSDR